MRKIFFVATMVLLSAISMNAQEKYEGSWLSGSSFEKYVEVYLSMVFCPQKVVPVVPNWFRTALIEKFLNSIQGGSGGSGT